MSPTVQTVFAASLTAFFSRYRLPRFLRFAADRLASCRTAKLGGHVHRCPNGHVERVWFNSCRHRACPQCGNLRTERWLERQQSRMLACSHFHVVFTISHLLDPLWRTNTRLMTDVLFRSARDTLFRELGQEGKFYLGTPGIVAALHTWGRNLHLHPHLHCLVTGGGLSDIGKWTDCRNGYLLPFQKARSVFRNRFLELLLRRLESGDLVLPNGWTTEKAKGVLLKAWKKKWNVHLREQYAHGNGVLKYLSRYVTGGPISNRRIVAFENGDVTYRYTDHEDGKTKIICLPVNRFIWRILQHVPEPGTQVVRHFGLYARQKSQDLEICRAQLNQPPVKEPREIRWEDYLERRSGIDPMVCPECGERLLGSKLKPQASARTAPSESLHRVA